MTERNRAWLLWLGLAIASSPALASLARSLRDEPSHRYTLLALLLVGLLLVRDGDPADRTRGPASDRSSPRVRSGLVVVGVGWGVQLLGAAAAASFIAQVGLALSIVGMGLVVGWPGPGVLVLAFGLIPVPGFVYAVGSPVVESWVGECAGRALDLLGLPVDSGGPLLQAAGRRFEIVATDSGLVTAICAVEVAWFRSLRERMPWQGAVGRALRAAVLGLLVQPLLVLLAAASLPLGQPELGRFLLSHGVPIALALFVLACEARSA